MIAITCMVNKTKVDIITSCIGLHYNCNLLTMLRIKSLNCIRAPPQTGGEKNVLVSVTFSALLQHRLYFRVFKVTSFG